MFSVNVVFCEIEKIGMMDKTYWKIFKIPRVHVGQINKYMAL